jgi:hypothetical protein
MVKRCWDDAGRVDWHVEDEGDGEWNTAAVDGSGFEVVVGRCGPIEVLFCGALWRDDGV